MRTKTLKIKWLILSCGLVLMFSFSLGAAQDAPQVLTNKGKIEGLYEKSSAVYQFKGVPFAKPPVGDLRWKAP